MCRRDAVRQVSDFFEKSGGSVAFPNSHRVKITQTFDQPIVIHSIAWRRSDSDSPYRNKFGEPRFVVFEFAFLAPNLSMYNTHTGAKQICERLERIEAMGVLPIRGTISLRDDGSYGIE